MNVVNLIGRITKDIELRATESGISIVSMFVAVNNGKDKDGNERPADFPKVYVYDKQAENVNKYCQKGSLVGITGRIKTRTWEKEDGTNGYETYISASNVQFLDPKKSDSVPLPEPDYVPEKEEEEEENNPYADFEEQIEISDEDLPF